MYCTGLCVHLARTQYPWPPPHFLCLISLFQLSPSCLLCSSPERLSVLVGQLTLRTYAFVPQAVGRAKIKLLEPVISPVLMPEETHMHPSILLAHFQEPGVGRSTWTQLGKGLDLTLVCRRRPGWVGFSSPEVAFPNSPFPLRHRW